MESIAREGMTGFDVAAEISQEMKKQALVARVNGEVVELWRPLHEGDRVEILTFEDEDGRRVRRRIAAVSPRRYRQMRPRLGAGRRAQPRAAGCRRPWPAPEGFPSVGAGKAAKRLDIFSFL